MNANEVLVEHFKANINTYANSHPVLLVRQLAFLLRAEWNEKSSSKLLDVLNLAEETITELVDDLTDRFNIYDPSTNPGIVANASMGRRVSYQIRKTIEEYESQ